MALSPAVLSGLSGALGSALDVRTRERIVTYLCLKLATIDSVEIALNRRGASSDPKACAAVAFGRKIAETHGRATDTDLQAVRAASYTDAHIIEIIAVLAENVFANMVNIAAETEIDCPIRRAAETD